MTQVCQCCNHPKRLEMDKELVAGKNISKLAQEYGVSYDSLYYHSQNHLSRQLVQAYERKRQTEDFDLLSRIEQILSRCEKIFRRNFKKDTASGDNLALKSIAEQRQTFELLAKIAAHLHQVRALELQMAQSTTDNSLAEREAEFAQKAADHLNEAEMDMLEQLLSKVEGEHSLTIIPTDKPYKVPSFTPPEPDSIPELPEEPAPKVAGPLHKKPIQRPSKPIKPYSVKPKFR